MSGVMKHELSNGPVDVLDGLEDSVEALREVGRQFYARGWSMGTSSNYSVVTNRNPAELLVTASGKDKGQLKAGDFVRVGSDGMPVTSGQPKSSAETMLHVAVATHPRVGANVGSILHTHSIWGTVLSHTDFDPASGEGELRISGYEMLKGLEGIQSHETSVAIKIFDNTQDITSLSQRLVRLFDQGEPSVRYGFLMRGHGLYTWGASVADARRHVEVLEFLLEVVGRTRGLSENNSGK